MMFRILGKEIYPEESEILMELSLTKPEDLDEFELSTGAWEIREDGLVGVFRGNSGGICYTRKSFPGNILIDFYGTMLEPCCNDLNFFLKAKGWNYAANDDGGSFIGGLNGWYDNKSGFEKYPACKTQALVSVEFQSGVEYHIQAGYCEDTVFLAVDGKLLVEMHDPNPEELADFGRIGLGTYCSQIRFRDLKIQRPAWKAIQQSYTPNF